MIKIFYDVETTGVNPRMNSIHQLAGMIEVDGHIKTEFDFRIKPHPKAVIEPEALKIAGVTEEEILAYPDMALVHKQFIKMLDGFIDRFDKKQKAYLVGFNNRSFDDIFLRTFFELSGNSFFGAYFWPDSHDTLVLASYYLQERRADMPSFKLKRVATEVGIVCENEGLHNALFDARLTRQIYRIVTGLEIEI